MQLPHRRPGLPVRPLRGFQAVPPRCDRRRFLRSDVSSQGHGLTAGSPGCALKKRGTLWQTFT